MRNDYKWLENFYDESIIKFITESLYINSKGLIEDAFEICHAIQSYVKENNSKDKNLIELNKLLNKYNYYDNQIKNWKKNPNGLKIYNLLKNNKKDLTAFE